MALVNSSTNTEIFISSFVGIERCDMILQLAKLLRNAKAVLKENGYNNILVIDNTYSQELYNTVSIEGSTGVADYRGITIVSGAGYTPREFIKYDHVLIFHGINIDKDLLTCSDNVFVITNYEKNLNKRIGKKMEAIELHKPVTVIYRDQIGHKVTEKNINHYLSIPDRAVRSQTIVKFDQKDYMLYLALTFNGSQKIKNYSEGFIKALCAMVCVILNWDDATASKYFKKLIKRAR